MTVKVIGGKSGEWLEEDIEAEFRPHFNLSQLNCPHILAVFGKRHHKCKIPPHLGYIYMEYAPFGDLSSLTPLTNNK